MISRVLIKDQPRRRWLTGIAGLGLVVALLGLAGAALAVHDLAFQLDGNTSTVAGTVPNPANQTLDWDSLFNADGSNTSLIDPNNTTGFTSGAFVRDFQSKSGRNGTCSLSSTGTVFCTADHTTYATGSKDSLDITGWQCNQDNNVNSKIDIMNAYAAQYIAGNGDRIMYFGLDKNKDNGNNNVAFWFLRGNADCSSTGSAVDFTGKHSDGDVLVVSAFTNGGGVSNISAYRWDGTNGCIDNPAIAGNCDGQPVASGGDCKIAPLADDICATTNSGPDPINTNITTQWLTADATLGVGHTVVPPDFFEGGINLSQVLDTGGVPSCFNTFLADTRSSQSLTATLFDFARGQLGGCSTTLTTAAGNTDNGGSASPSSIGTGSVSSGTDTASLTVTGTATWSGTMTWYLCGPVSADGCDNTGVQVTSRSVSQASPASDFVSGSATLTSAGRYCWTAHFEPSQASSDAGLPAADDNGAHECFTVAPVKPTLSTSASCGVDPCVLGSTLSDTATIDGTANQPGDDGALHGGNSKYPSINATNGAPAGGDIGWVLYGPTSGGCSAQKATSPASATISGDGTYGPTSYTTVAADGVGVYTFVANYPGNGPNTSAADAVTCAAPGSNEQVTVIGSATSSSAQRWLPNDRIVLSSTPGTTLTGTLTVTLYSGTFSGTADNCSAGSATAVAGQQYTFNPSGASSPAVFNTTNTTFFVGTKSDGTAAGAAGTYFWLIHYDDAGLSDPTDRCETSTLNISD